MLKGLKNKLIKLLELIGVTLLCLIVTLLGVIWVLEKGPSPTMTATFTRSVRETSALKFISKIFLSEEELERYKSVSTEETMTESVDTALIDISGAEFNSSEPDLQLIDISAGTCKGKLLIVKDPKRVILGTSENFYYEPGLLVTDMVKKYGGIAGTNAGGFHDDGGQGDGGSPDGLVICDGKLLAGNGSLTYNIVGLNNDGILIVNTMSGNDALAQGVKYGVSFTTFDGVASALIINGEIQKQNLGGGVNPRTAIGQRADGAILLLVLDGRSISTLGASLQNVAEIMLEYGAVNAGNLDGGSSSVMVYEDEIINNCASVTGPRRVPTGFIVLKEGDSVG